MARQRKYPKTTGHYNYAHILPNEMFYIGESNKQPCYRWQPSRYKNTVLGPYIKQYGWENIKHVILKDGLTKEQSEQLEDLLIQEATRLGFCLNKRRSGGIERDNPKEYRCEYQREYNQRPEVKQHRRERQRENYKKRKQTEKYKEYQRQYRLKKKQQTNKEQ